MSARLPGAVRRRGGIPALAFLIVAALVGALLGAGPAEAGRSGTGRTADKPWSGFALRAGDSAAAGFVGARRIRRTTVVYRVDPEARARTKGFEPGVYVDTFQGSGKQPASVESTQQAAYIVGKYGAYKDKVQDAAVELALDHLLVGGTWSLKGKRTKQRLAQVKQASQVRRIAKDMLRNAHLYASTYSVTMVTTQGATIAQPVTATVSVRATRTGLGVQFLDVTISFPGAAPVTLKTDAAGNASATFTAGTAGPVPVTATVANVPEGRLVVLTPTTRKASRVVVADVKTTGGANATAAVRALPVAAIRTSYGSLPTPYSTAGQAFTVASTYASARTATATLYGPYGSDAAAVCRGTVAGTGKVKVTANGSYKLPTLTLAKVGFYRWLVNVPADAYNNATSTCGGVQRRAAS